jgi:riboflavin transporter FmnP
MSLIALYYVCSVGIHYNVYLMIPIYFKLFNFIFDKGVVPVSWSVGVITPIFKNKGSSKDHWCLLRYRTVSSLLKDIN